MPPTLVVLAAGSSTRFGSRKQLVPVGPSGEALLDYALFDAARAGFGAVVLVVRDETEPEFRAHCADVIGEAIPIRFVPQRLDLSQHRASAHRTKPWGTGHAVLAAGQAVSGPFAVCNADDFYGASAFRQVHEHLMSRDAASAEHALVGYRLRGTLSPHGGVSRAIVEQDANGYLVRLTEVREVAQGPDGIAGAGSLGTAVRLGGDEPVSMNLWGFTPQVVAALEQQFETFVEQHGTDLAAEFLLSEALGAQVVAGTARVRVLPARDDWCGMTVAADMELVRQAVGERVAGGAYPHDLRARFRNR